MKRNGIDILSVVLVTIGLVLTSVGLGGHVGKNGIDSTLFCFFLPLSIMSITIFGVVVYKYLK